MAQDMAEAMVDMVVMVVTAAMVDIKVDIVALNWRFTLYPDENALFQIWHDEF